MTAQELDIASRITNINFIERLYATLYANAVISFINKLRKMPLQRLYLPQFKSEEVVTILSSPLFRLAYFHIQNGCPRIHELIIYLLIVNYIIHHVYETILFTLISCMTTMLDNLYINYVADV